MPTPEEAYKGLVQWVQDADDPDMQQFDSLLSDLIQSVMTTAVENTRQKANSGTEHVDLIQEYAENKGYERFFTS